MRHRMYGRQFGRDSEHRRAMLRNLAAGLFEHGEIETTLPKARAVQPFVEKLITIARKGGLHARRQLEARLNDRRIHAWVTHESVPDAKKDNAYFDLPDASEIEMNRYGELRKAPRLIQHLMTVVAPMFEGRDGGYTRIVKLGKRRLGDGADLVLLQLVGREEGPEVGGGMSGRRKQADRRTAYAARLRKSSGPEPVGGGATAVAEPEAEATAAEARQEQPEAETQPETPVEAEGAAETEAEPGPKDE